MYRAVGWKALHDGVPLDDEEAVSQLASRSTIDVDATRVTIDDKDVTSAIRTPEIDRAAAIVARLAKVRAVLVHRQRIMGAGKGIVMEGRDIGTVVFPDAEIKIYLDASPEERARRRANDPAHSGGAVAVADVATRLSERDELDRTRKASPLLTAADAVVVDTTGRNIPEVVADVLRMIERKRRENADRRDRGQG
jgi:cytidylate kinase